MNHDDGAGPGRALKHSNGVALQLSPAVAVAVAPTKAEGMHLKNRPVRASLSQSVRLFFFFFLQVTWAGLY